MTKKEMFTALYNYISNDPAISFDYEHKTGNIEDISNSAMLEFLSKEINALSKKRASSSSGNSKADKERAEMRSKILDWLREHPSSTATDIQNAFGISNQKVNGLIRPLVKSNEIIRVTIKNKPYFSVANTENTAEEVEEIEE